MKTKTSTTLKFAILMLMISSCTTATWTKWRGDFDNTGAVEKIALSGNVVWTNNQATFNSSGVFGEKGSTFYFNSGNQIISVDAATGIMKHSFQAGAPIYSTPSISDNTLYFGASDLKFYALNESDLSIQWSTYIGGSFLGSPASLGGSRVYAGSTNGKVYALNTSDGTIAWTYQTEGEIKSSPALNPRDDLLYIGSTDGNVYALRMIDGSLAWKLQVGGAVDATPVYSINTDNVYVGTLNSRFIAIKAGGIQLWSITTPAPITERNSPAVVKYSSQLDHIFFGDDDGNFYMYEANISFVRVLTASIRLPDKFLTAPIADKTGMNVVVGAYHRLHKLAVIPNPDPGINTFIFSDAVIHDFGSNILAAPAMSSDGSVFIANGGKMFAIN